MKRIRLTESQLHKVIKESVKRVLEENDADSYLEIAHEVSDEIQEFLDENDIDAYTTVVRGYDGPEIDISYTYVTSSYADGPGLDNSDEIRHLIPQIKQIFDCSVSNPKKYHNGGGEFSYENTCTYVWTLYVNYESWLMRKDKNYAMEKGFRNPQKFKDSEMEDMWRSNSETNDAKDDEINKAWNKEGIKKFPHIFKSDGSVRHMNDMDKFQSDVYKDTIGTDQADKRPLHRKGSLNRALGESIHKTIKKVLH